MLKIALSKASKAASKACPNYKMNPSTTTSYSTNDELCMQNPNLYCKRSQNLIRTAPLVTVSVWFLHATISIDVILNR